jgi:hypothetical protein
MQLFIYMFTSKKKINNTQERPRFGSVTLLMIPHQEWGRLQKKITGSRKFANDFEHVCRYWKERGQQLVQRYKTYRCVRILSLSYTSVRQSTCISADCNDRGAVKFDIGDRCDNLSRNSRLGTIGQKRGNAHKNISAL